MSDHGYPHEPTGIETRKLGMWIFLSTEILFFGTLITTYLIFKGRTFDGIKLEEVYDIPFTSVSSFVLLMSSLAMVSPMPVPIISVLWASNRLKGWKIEACISSDMPRPVSATFTLSFYLPF